MLTTKTHERRVIHAIILFLLSATVVVCSPAFAQNTPYPVLQAPVRNIPVPDTVSPELQAMIAQPFGNFDPPYPVTNDAWTYAFESRADQSKRISALLADKHVTMDKRVIGGVNCFVLTPATIPAKNANRLLLNFHGGGYAMGAGEGGTTEAILLAAASGIKVIAVDYHTTPEFPFPAALNDAMAVWKAVIKDHDPAKIGLFGTSAGGSLVLSLVQRAKLEGLPVPGAISSGTPMADLSLTGDSYYINDFGQPSATKEFARIYANGLDLKDPRISPVYGDFSGFPPTILTSGTRDVFLSNTVRVDLALRKAGVETRLQVFEGQYHGAYLNPALPESRWAFEQIALFMDTHLKH